MKTKKRPVKKASGTVSSRYGCNVCGAVIEVDPCGCGCDSAASLVCCGKRMTKKRAR